MKRNTASFQTFLSISLNNKKYYLIAIKITSIFLVIIQIIIRTVLIISKVTPR